MKSPSYTTFHKVERQARDNLRKAWLMCLIDEYRNASQAALAVGIDKTSLSRWCKQYEVQFQEKGGLKVSREDILACMNQNMKKTQAARHLKISTPTLYRAIERYKISWPAKHRTKTPNGLRARIPSQNLERFDELREAYNLTPMQALERLVKEAQSNAENQA